MNYIIDLQNATKEPLPLSEEELKELAMLALRDQISAAELTIRLVEPEEMIDLNYKYRNKNKTTNVLAFPSSLPEELQSDCPFLGDVIICPQVLITECNQLDKLPKEHWSLIVIHGILHLLGYDHIKEDEAIVMQTLEIKLLAELGFSNPYEIEDQHFE